MEHGIFGAELRANAESGQSIEGYAATFNQLSVVLGGMFREEIAPGAFAITLKNETDIRSLWNHNTDFPLARTTNGTLLLSEDDHGLAIRAELPNTSWGKDALISIQRKDVTQMSFAFDALDDEWREDNEGQIIRRLSNVKLYEVSPVTFPAYPSTSVSMRSFSNEVPTWVVKKMQKQDRKLGVSIELRKKYLQLMSYR
jgi:uncharacterized protein